MQCQKKGRNPNTRRLGKIVGRKHCQTKRNAWAKNMNLSELGQKYAEGTLTAAEVQASGYIMNQIRNSSPLDLIAIRYAEGTFPSEEFKEFHWTVQNTIKVLAENHPTTQKIWATLCEGIPDLKNGEISFKGHILDNERGFTLKLMEVSEPEVQLWNLDLSKNALSNPTIMEVFAGNMEEILKEETGIEVTVTTRKGEVAISWYI